MNALKLGQVLATPGALDALEAARVDWLTLLRRHAHGDWGDLCDEDKRRNEEAVKSGDRILSAYPVGSARVWIITERGRTATTLLLPEEY
jgi:hypothetical protein